MAAASLRENRSRNVENLDIREVKEGEVGIVSQRFNTKEEPLEVNVVTLKEDLLA